MAFNIHNNDHLDVLHKHYARVVVLVVVFDVKSATKLQMSMSTYKPLQIQREVKLHAAFLHKSEQEIVDGTLQK